MKKIIFLLLLSVASYGQAKFDKGIKLSGNIETANSQKVITQDPTSGNLNYINATNLPLSTVAINELKLKSYLSTGLLKNGLIQINADPTKFNVTAGTGVISNFDDPDNPTSVIVNFPAFTGITPTYLLTGNITYVAINSVPAIVMQASPFTPTQRRDLIELGAVIHSNLTTINTVNNISSPSNSGTNQLHDVMDFIGALNLEGNKYTANGANLSLDKSAGIIGKRGVNFANNWKDPHRLAQSAGTALTFRYRTQNGTEGSDVTVLNPALYDLSNVLTAVPNNKFTIQTVIMFQTGLTRILYGQSYYDDLASAKAAIFTRNFVMESNAKENGIIRAYIIMRNTTTSLQNVADADIQEAQKFGGVASGGVALTFANIVAALGYTPENVANKTGTLTASSTLYPNNNAVIAGLALKSDKANFVNIIDLGGVGDGVFDNTSIINSALVSYKEVYFPDGNYLVTSLVNNYGAKITGSGVIKKTVTGGTQQLNTGIDKYNYVFGQEYLSFFQKKVIDRGINNSTSLKVSWSGDSTTEGSGISNSGYLLHNLFTETTDVNSIANINSLNRGHSGLTTEQWRTTYLAADLAENPDLYIIRWGINDPAFLKSGAAAPADAGDTYPNRRDIGDFTTSLRSALTTIRASKTQAQMSIILMSPNPTSDVPNARDEKWYEQVRKVYTQAARDFQCAYIDTYALWLDSRNGAAGLYMDDPFADGRAIHPKDVFNTWIVSKVFDLVFPSSLRTKLSGGYLVNESSVDRIPVFTDLPETYRKGITLNRGLVSDGWSVDGTVNTVFNTDGSGYQFNVSRFTDVPEIYFRSFKGEYISEALSWSNTVKLLHTGNMPPSQITITTSVSITTATLASNGYGQSGRNTIIDNGVNAINLTVNGGTDFVSSYLKHGTGAITFVQGSGRTMIQVDGTAILNGAVGSTATISSIGTTDYLQISNK